MKITRIGHACVLIEGSKILIVDPYITDNPASPLTTEEIPKLDYVLITHDHYDHFGEAVQLAKRDGAQLIAIYEVTARGDVVAAGLKTVSMNIGGTFKKGGISVCLTPAVHSTENGSPVGFVINLDGRNLYHAGDTALFSDMKLIPELCGPLDVALLPIGGHFTMDITAAVKAVEILKPTVTIPIHYNTWPPIQADPEVFAKAATATKVIIVEPGEAYEVTG